MPTTTFQKSYSVCRGELSAAAIAGIYDQWCTYRNFLDDKVKTGQAGEPRIAAQFRLNAITVDYLMRWPQFHEPVFDMLRLMFGTSYLGFIRRRIGPDFYLSLGFATFRSQPPDTHPSHLPMHQDAVIYGEDVTVLNMWLPLMDCGKNAPGLSFVRSHPGRRVFDYDKLVSGVRLGGVDFERKAPGGPSAIVDDLIFNQGDFVLFDHHALHRTHVTPTMTQERVAIELRVYDRIPKKQLVFPFWSSEQMRALGLL